MKPHYILEDIQAAFSDPDKLNTTYTATNGAQRLGLALQDVTNVIQNLTASDFDKSMTSYADHKIWQDVYKPNLGETPLYVKFTLDSAGKLLLISFKEA